MPLQKSERRPFRTHIELVVSSELNKLLSSYKLEGRSLVDIVGGQLNYQWGNLKQKFWKQFNQSRTGLDTFYTNLIFQFQNEKEAGMKLLENIEIRQQSKPAPEDVVSLLETVQRLGTKSLEDCGDHMRLIGTVIDCFEGVRNDNGSGILNFMGQGYAYLKQFKDTYRDQIAFSPVRRRRMRREKPVIRDRHLITINGLTSEIKEKGVGVFGDYKWMDGNRPSGISSTELLPDSCIKNIDDDYDLPYGADISGTTADALFNLHVFSTEVVGNAEDLEYNVKNCLCPIAQDYTTWIYQAADPQDIKKQIMELRTVPMCILNLIPLATMVYQYHHTILEIAGTMSLVGTMDYYLGEYNTLLYEISERDLPAWGDLYFQIGKKLNEIDSKVKPLYPNFPRIRAAELLGR